MKQSASIFLLFSLFFFPINSSATFVINTKDHPAGVIYMSELVPDKILSSQEIRSLQKEEKALVRFERRMEKIQKQLDYRLKQNNSGIFSNPVGKWLWIWLISWGLGILLFVISNGSIGVFLAVVMLLAFVVGSVSVVLWLKKQFG